MPTSAPNLDDLYDEAGYKYNVDPLRLKAHAIQETGEKADVPSSDGKSWGFGQFTPETWKRMMPGVPLAARGDPQTAIEAMARLLARNDDAHRDQYGNVDLLASTAAYNGSGPAADAYAKKIQAIHGRLVTDGGLHLTGGPGGQGKPAANDDDAFSQTLKGQPAGPADKPAADDAFSQTLKGGPAQEASEPDAFGLDVSKMTPQPDYAGAVKMGENLSTVAGVRNALAPPEGYTPSGILPLAVKNDPSGQADPSLGVRWDLGPLRPLATGVLDLLQGPATGTITPEARNVLFGAMTGGQLLPSVARGTGAAVAGAMQAAADRTAAPLSPEFTSHPLSPNYAGPREVVSPGQMTAASPGMGGPQTQAAGAAPQFLDSAWIKQQASDASGAYDMEAGGKAIAGAVEDALKRGDTVTYMADGGRKAVPIVAVKNGMMQDATGQRWGAAQLASDGTGKEGVQITPKSGAAPGMGGPQPRAVGAEATSEPIPPLTPAQKASDLQKMIGQSAEDRLTPQGRDDNVYFPGVARPEAMKDFTPASEGEMSTALQHKTLYNTDSHYHDRHDAQIKANNAVMTDGTTLPDGTRVDGLKDMFGDANTRDKAMDHARELMPGSADLFKDEKPVDVQPIADKIKEILASGAGKTDAVANTLKGILPKLYDAAGKPETMPSIIKGIFDDINNKLYDKSPTTEGNAARISTNQLKDVKAVVSDVIGKGLPGTKWKDYLTNLSGALGEVNKLDYMQRFLSGPKGLWGSDGMLKFNKVKNMLQDILDHHADQTGGARQMTMEEINKIEAVRNELAAKDLLDRRADVRGSPTVQLGTGAGILGSGPLGTAVKTIAEGGAHLALAPLTAGVGNVGLLAAKGWAAGRKAKAAQKEANALAATKNRLLDTTPNPLAGP